MKIACLLGPMFEDSEFQKPYEAFREAGYEVTIISTEAGKELKGDKGKVTTKSEKGIAEVRSIDFDALFIPGGVSPDKLRADDRIVNFTREFFTANKPIFAICHGPQLLLSADCHKGYRLTAWKTVRGDLEKAGANVVDEEAVVERNVVSSRMPDDIPAFIRESLALLKKIPAHA
jgi:protease I